MCLVPLLHIYIAPRLCYISVVLAQLISLESIQTLAREEEEKKKKANENFSLVTLKLVENLLFAYLFL